MMWVLIQKTGKLMPVDPEPVQDGNIVLEERAPGMDPLGTVYANPNAVPIEATQRYVSHFVTCPNADKHRKRKRR